MSYVNESDVRKSLVNMIKFYQGLKKHFDSFDVNVEDNIGRRNMFMSPMQETFLANALSEKYEDVISDGAPGQPDIVVGEINRELECKLTSVNVAGGLAFQTDYETLAKKGKLDYIYYITNKEFDKFTVLYFKDLDVNDFRGLSNGARGKVSMYKHKGMKKCTILYGSATNNNDIELKKLSDLQVEENINHMEKTSRYFSKLSDCSTAKQREKYAGIMEREIIRHDKKLEKLNKRANYWHDIPTKYSFNLQEV